MNSLIKYTELRKRTIPDLLLDRAKSNPQQVAYRFKKCGIYQEKTWSQFAHDVAICTAGLTDLGLKRGERLALMGDPCEAYVICDLAATSLGAVTYGIYPTTSPKGLKHLLQDGGASILILENQEFYERVVPMRHELRRVRQFIIIDTKGIFSHETKALTTFYEILERGETMLQKDPVFFERLVAKVKPEDHFSIVYTSGTTGDPKGTLISHGKHLAAAYTIIERYPILSQIPHRTVVHVPLCHLLGKVTAITLPLLTRIVPHYAENPEDLLQTFFETTPSILFTFPRFLQRISSSILSGMEGSSPLKKILFSKARRFGERNIKKLWQGGKNSLLSRIAFSVYYHTVFRPILNKFGFDRLKLVLTTDTPLSTEASTFWQILGVNISQFYTFTETGGAAITTQGAYYPKPGHMGTPTNGWKVKISNGGEIFVSGPDLAEGYWNDAQGARAALDNGGWFYPKDIGEWTPEGNLKVVDKVQDMITTVEGISISPASIANLLKSSSYINEAAIFCLDGHRITALIEVEHQTVSEWAQAHDIPLTDFSKLFVHPEIVKLIGAEVERANQRLSAEQHVVSFRIIPKILNPLQDDEPVTPNRKVKRSRMGEHFSDLIATMYG